MPPTYYMTLPLTPPKKVLKNNKFRTSTILLWEIKKLNYLKTEDLLQNFIHTASKCNNHFSLFFFFLLSWWCTFLKQAFEIMKIWLQEWFSKKGYLHCCTFYLPWGKTCLENPKNLESCVSRCQKYPAKQ